MAITPRQKKISKLKTSGDVFLFNEIERIEKKLPDLKQLIELLIGKKAERVETKNTDIKKKLAKLSDDSDFFLLKEIQALEEQIPDITGLASAFALKQPEKGDKGDTGATGESIKGDKGDIGERGKMGLEGRVGKTGEIGLRGSDGIDGKNGQDGSPDSPEEIVEKINTLEEVVDYSVLKNVPDLVALENNIRMSIPRTLGGGGTNEILEDGIKTGSSHRLNFGSGFDTEMVNGTINISLDGSEPTNMNLQNITDNGNTTTNSIEIIDEGLITDYIDFDLESIIEGQEGRLMADIETGGLIYGLKGGIVNLNIGEEFVKRVTNNTGVTIPNGTPVYITGSLGNNLTIAPADASYVVGVAFRTYAVTTEEILDGQKGYVTKEGVVRDIDLSSYAAGQPLYLAVGGGYTTTVPTSPDVTILIGVVEKATASGELDVGITSVPNLNSLSDVISTGIANNDFPVWVAAENRYEMDNIGNYSGTLAEVSALSNDTAKSLYQMTAGVPVEFRATDGFDVLLIDETERRVTVRDDFLVTSTAGNIRFSVSGANVSFNSQGGQTFVAGYSGPARMNVGSLSAAAIPLAIRGVTSQTGDLMRVDISGTTTGEAFKIDALGDTYMGGGLDVKGIVASNIDGGELRSYQAEDSFYISVKTDTGSNKSGLFRSNTDFFAYYDTVTGSTHLDATFANSDIIFDIMGVEKMRVDSSGGVIINSLTASKGVYTDGSKQLTSTAPTSGILGHWDRTGTTLSPSNAGDDVVLDGSLSIGSTPTYATARKFKIYDDGVDGNARMSMIQSTDSPLGAAIEFVNGGNTSQRALIRFDKIVAGYGLNFFVSTGSTVFSAMQLNGSGHLYPSTNNVRDLGLSANRWRDIYTTDIDVSGTGTFNQVNTDTIYDTSSNQFMGTNGDGNFILYGSPIVQSFQNGGANGTVIDLDFNVLIDNGLTNSIDWSSRYLYDSFGSQIVDWSGNLNTGTIQVQTGISSNDILLVLGGGVYINSAEGWIDDGSQTMSVHPSNHQLGWNNGGVSTVVLDWSTGTANFQANDITTTGKIGAGISPTTAIHADSNAANTTAIVTIENTAGNYQSFRVDADPEGVVTGSIGDTANDTTNGFLYYKHTGNATNTGWVVDAGAPAFKSYSMANPGTSDTFYIGGSYNYASADTTLTIGGTVTQTFGSTGDAHGAHAFIVASGAGGTDLVLTVTGISITDAGVRNDADSEIVVADADTATLNQYLETSKKWLGQVTYTLTGAAGAFTFNYGFAKYEDFGNRDFTVTDFEGTGEARANESGLNIELLHHQSSAFLYHATAFIPNQTAVVDMATDYGTNDNVNNGDNFAYKRAGLSESVLGGNGSGVMIRVTTNTNNSINDASFHIGVLLR